MSKKKQRTTTKSTADYIEELKEMIELANDGKPYSPWMMPLIRATAMNMVILDKLQTAIEDEDYLTSSGTGSMGQQKISANPLLDKYYKAQDELLDQLASLGLTVKNSRKDSTPQSSTGDPMADFYANAKR